MGCGVLGAIFGLLLMFMRWPSGVSFSCVERPELCGRLSSAIHGANGHWFLNVELLVSFACGDDASGVGLFSRQFSILGFHRSAFTVHFQCFLPVAVVPIIGDCGMR